MKHKKCLTASAFAVLLIFFSCLGIALPKRTGLSDIIEVKALYKDGEGFARALIFEQSEPLTDLKVQIDGVSHTVTASPGESGLVFEYFEENRKVKEITKLKFTAGGKGCSVSVRPIDIVTTDEEWEMKGNTLICYKGKGGEVIVPNYYNDRAVISVGGNVSYDEEGSPLYYINILSEETKPEITSLTISEGILNIYPCAFYNLTALKSVCLPESLEKIYEKSFSHTGITSIDFPDGLKMIGDSAFYECSWLSGDITIPAGVTEIGRAAFYNCPNVTGTLTLCEGVEEIGELAFGSDGYSASPNIFEGFTGVVLPGTLKKIGPYAFQYCTNISALTLPEGLETISDGAFDHMTGLTNTSLTIPSAVTVIGGDNGVEENTGYGGHVFYDMGQNETFTEFILAKGNKSFAVKDGVLYSADMTRMLGYPRGKRETAFEIPEGITLLDELSFSRAAYLETVTLPDSYEITTDIPENILNKDNGNSLSIALYLYTGVKTVEVKETNIRYRSEKGIVYSKDMKTLWYVPSAYDKDIFIAEGCEVMESGSIYTTNSNKVNIYIPSSVREINDNVIDILDDCFAGLIWIDEGNICYKVDSKGKITEVFNGGED